MKININKIRLVPKSITNQNFEFCVFGQPDEEISKWIAENGFKSYSNGKYTNISISGSKIESLASIFDDADVFEWLDGFSPNLNKKLHIGHFSNLVLGKAFLSLGIAKNTVSIYGDTLEGEITKEDAISALEIYHNLFDFHPNASYFASEMQFFQFGENNMLVEGEGQYAGTMIFNIDEETKVVGIKTNGQTSYFYQDVCLAAELNAATLYLTGKEQDNHFKTLKRLFPVISHIGLGLVRVSGQKMSSRIGNVILIDEFIELVKNDFENNMQLIYNVFAGFILKSAPEVDKGINLDIISNPKNSSGLYISYTMARLQSAGCSVIRVDGFKDLSLQFALLKSKVNLKPNILFEALLEHCKEINALYAENKISGNSENKIMFENLLSDLVYGAEKLGMFVVDKV